MNSPPYRLGKNTRPAIHILRWKDAGIGAKDQPKEFTKPDVVDIRLRGSYGFNVLVRNGQNDMPGHTKLMTILRFEDCYTESWIYSL